MLYVREQCAKYGVKLLNTLSVAPLKYIKKNEIKNRKFNPVCEFSCGKYTLRRSREK